MLVKELYGMQLNKKLREPIEFNFYARFTELEEQIIRLVGQQVYDEYETLSTLMNGEYEERAYIQGFEDAKELLK